MGSRGAGNIAGAGVSITSRDMFHRDRQERELDAELRAYVDLLVDEKIEAGMSPDEARRQALLEIGDIERVKAKVRAVHRAPFLETLWLDFRHAARALRRSPTFTIVVVLTLTIGIGSSTVMMTVVNGVLLRQLDVPGASLVMAVSESNGDRGLRRPSATASSLNAWRRDNASFELLAAYLPHNVDLTESGEPQEVVANDLSRNFLSIVGARTVIGHPFSDDDFQDNGADVVMLDERYWRAAAGADVRILGRTLTVNGIPRTVIGIMRTGWPRGSELYLPMRDTYVQTASPGRRLLAVGRLRTNVALEAAQTELLARAKHL